MNPERDDDSYSDFIDEFDNHSEESSPLQGFEQNTRVPPVGEPRSGTTKSEGTDESDDTYSTDDDFEILSKEDELRREGLQLLKERDDCRECPVPNNASLLFDNRHVQNSTDNKSPCEQGELPEISVSYRESHDSYVTSNVPIESTEIETGTDSAIEYIGEVNCTISTSGEAVSASSPPTVHERGHNRQHCRVSFDPICVFISKKAPSSPQVPRMKQYSKKRLDELCKPSKHNIYNTPEKKEHSTKGTQSSKASKSEKSFLERMEMMENEKREKLRRAAAELTFNARLDKNACRNCGTYQSYDEMINGKKYCKSELCKKGKYQYLPPRKFKLKNFEKRMEKNALRRRLSIAKITEDQRASFTSTMPKRNRRQQSLIEKVSVDDFFTRMAKDIRARKEKLIQLEHDLRLEREKTSLKPKVKKKKMMTR